MDSQSLISIQAQKNEWRIVQLNDICNWQGGYSFKNLDYDSEETDSYIVFRMGNIKKGGGINREAKKVFISKNKAKNLSRFVLKKNDICMCMTDMKASMNLLGHTALIDKDDIFILNQRVGKITIKDEKITNYRYLYYHSNSPIYIDYLHSVAHSGVQVNLSTKAILESPIMLPPLDTQRKIAAVLSAYDDLIENNTRHIQILEEIAQAIYREWFVHFRFPGHEGVRMVDSGTELGDMPDGWKVERLSDIAIVVDCSHARKPQSVEGSGNLLLHVWNVGDSGKLDLSKHYDISDEDYVGWIRRIEVQEGDCIITKTGRVGAVAKIPRGIKAALGRNLVCIRWKQYPNFLVRYLLSSHKDDNVIRLKSSGTIMESLHVKAIDRFLVLVPTNPLLDKFEKKIHPIQQQIELLSKKNDNLRVTRGLLLPRLVSMEVDVRELDISTDGM